MGSLNDGKDFIVKWIKERFPKGATALDVGACDGRWAGMLGDYLRMDAVEIFAPNVEQYRLHEKYNAVFTGDIADFHYDWYDLIIFGDVVEHMEVDKAQRVLAYARTRCSDMIIAVPYLYPQGAAYGNPWERHIQDDLTREVFDSRYPGFKLICKPSENYAYYAKNKP